MADMITAYGNINIQKSIILDIVEDSMKDLSGKARLGNTKMRVGFLIKDPSSSISLDWEDGELSIEVMIIVRFGLSINKIANEITKNISDRIEDILGIRPYSVVVNVTGSEFGKRIVRRDVSIEIYR